MNIDFVSSAGQSASVDLLVSACEEKLISLIASGKKPSKSFLGELNQELSGNLEEHIKREKYKAKDLESLSLPIFASDRCRNLVLIGLAPAKGESDFNRINRFRKFGSLICRATKQKKAKDVFVWLGDLQLDAECAEALVEGLLLSNYSFEVYKSKPKEDKAKKEAEFNLDDVRIKIATKAKVARDCVEKVGALCQATKRARDLINTPAKDCTPGHVVKQCREIAKEHSLKIEVLERKQLEKLGANALLAVASGSDEPPYLIKLTYKPKKASKEAVAIVGKGVTFDSGGLSIKPAGSMETMKYDMSGAAAVIGAMEAIAILKPKVEVRAYIPTTENMINGRAIRPGDVVRAMNGKSIEILNTDAEGRLILADALSLAVKEKATKIVDLATLTGACVVALGGGFAGLFTKDDRLAKELNEAATKSGEQLWRMPLPPEYKDLIKSPIADIKNTGGRWAGAITAALFLQEFVGDVTWAHLDIAGPAFAEGEDHHLKKGGVGFGVRTLVRFVGV